LKKAQLKSSLLLLIAAVIWGFAFVSQSTAMDHVGPFTFLCLRNIIGGSVLIPYILIVGKINTSSKNEDTGVKNKLFNKTLIIGGICCGLALFLASGAQQIGIQYTTTGKAGFITTFYMILVPIFGIFLKKKPSPIIWLAVVMALCGMYLLCITESFTIGRGDAFVFASAVLYSFQILFVDHFVQKNDPVKLAMMEFFVCGIVAAVFMIFEQPSLVGLWDARWAILYAGALSSGVAFTLQIVGQKNLNSAIASLIMSLESCFAVLGGWLILRQSLTAREFIGCVVMFAAILLTIFFGQKKEKKSV